MPGQGINVVGSSYNTPYIDMSRPSSGMVRYNGSSNNLEIYDGSAWIQMSSSFPTIELSYEVQQLLEWARQKRDNELRLKELSVDSPALQDAIATLKKAQEQVEILAALVKT